MNFFLPEILILSSQFDITCDFVVAELRRRKAKYLRLNTEELEQIFLTINPIRSEIFGNAYGLDFKISDGTLKSIFFRRPVFLRNYGYSDHTPFEEFKSHQWAAFLRNFLVLESVNWVNRPDATYKAEHKAYQLRKASQLGFKVPRTIISNSFDAIRQSLPSMLLAYKGLDTVILRDKKTETFGFTNFIEADDLTSEEIKAAPAIFQEGITDKLDIRVTVVGKQCFAASITCKGKPIEGDWRCLKIDADFSLVHLPNNIIFAFN